MSSPIACLPPDHSKAEGNRTDPGASHNLTAELARLGFAGNPARFCRIVAEWWTALHPGLPAGPGADAWHEFCDEMRVFCGCRALGDDLILLAAEGDAHGELYVREHPRTA